MGKKSERREQRIAAARARDAAKPDPRLRVRVEFEPEPVLDLPHREGVIQGQMRRHMSLMRLLPLLALR